jgi:hypothetical protein
VRKPALALAVAGLLACPGCATVFAGGPSLVDVEVEGPAEGVELLVSGTDDARVLHVDGRRTRLTLDRGATYAVMATAQGYKAEIGAIRTTTNPAVYLDVAPALAGLLAGGLLGNTTSASSLSSGLVLVSLGLYAADLLTHAASKHEANYLSLKLGPEATP